MPLTIPDKGEALSDNMSVLFEEHIRALVKGVQGSSGVLSGLSVQPVSGLQIIIDSGVVRHNGKDYPLDTISYTLAANATHPMFYIAVADTTLLVSEGVGGYVPGAAATPPKVQTLPDKYIPLAFIYVPAGATALTSANIVDARVFINAAAGISGFKNRLFNSSFQINQRGYVSAAATTAGQYTLDRWKVTGTGGISWSTTANKTTVTIPSGQAFQQVIEGLNLQSGTYVLSWEGTAQGKIGAGSLGDSGITGTITGGADTTIEFGPGTVANVQLELGLVPTPFEHRPIGAELALCQRYYWLGLPIGGANFGSYAVGAYFTLAISFPVEMRASPTLSSSLTGITLNSCNTPTWASPTTIGGRLLASSTAITTNANYSFAVGNYLAADAEL